jgi:hypothetical protein
MPGQTQEPSPAPARVSALAWAFRFLRWTTYLAALITILLILKKAPAPAVQTTPQAAARAEQKLAQAVDAPSAAPGQPRTVTLDETELNSLLASRIKDAMMGATAPASSAPASDNGPALGTSNSASPAASEETGGAGGAGAPSPADIEQVRNSVRDVKVQMEGDQVHAYVVFDVHGKDMTLDLVGKLGAEDGYLKFVPVSGQLGALPIPQSALESAVRQMMESPDNREKLKLPPDVADLKIENGQLVTIYK